MLRYRGMQLIRTGFIGVVLVILVILVGLAPEKLSAWATSVRYQALFEDAGGLATGNDVTVSGIKVGSVSKVALEKRNAVVTFTLGAKPPRRRGLRRPRHTDRRRACSAVPASAALEILSRRSVRGR